MYGFPTIVRFSWKTTKTILDSHGTSANWHDLPVDEKFKPDKGNSKMTDFMKKKEERKDILGLRPLFKMPSDKCKQSKNGLSRKLEGL